MNQYIHLVINNPIQLILFIFSIYILDKLYLNAIIYRKIFINDKAVKNIYNK